MGPTIQFCTSDNQGRGCLEDLSILVSHSGGYHQDEAHSNRDRGGATWSAVILPTGMATEPA